MRSPFSALAGLSALGLSLGSFAALPTAASAFQLDIPHLKPGIVISLEALFLQPSPNYTYATIIDAGLISPQNLEQNYKTSFRIGLAYVFANSGNDVQVSWLHFHEYNSASLNIWGQTLVVNGQPDPLSGEIFDQPSNTWGTASIDTQLDAIDLDVGQYWNIGSRLQTRFFAGLRAAEIESDSNTDYKSKADISSTLGNPATTNYYGTHQLISMYSEFKGIGPRFGVDSSYQLGHCFGLIAHFALAALAGEQQDSNSFDYYTKVTPLSSTAVLNPNPQTFYTTDSRDSSRVVPVLDGKLGVNYSYAFRQRFTTSLELGYQATEFFSAIEQFAPDGSSHSSNFAVNGPYANLSLHL